jgi:hypothetical protein
VSPTESDTVLTVDVASFQPTTTTNASAATCADPNVTTTDCPDVGNALACCTNTGAAATVPAVTTIAASDDASNATTQTNARHEGRSMPNAPPLCPFLPS